MVAVSAYEKKDGTQVQAHSRSAPGARSQLGILAVVTLAVVAMSTGGGSAGQNQNDKPRPLVNSPHTGQQKETPVIRITFPAGAPAKGGSR